MLKLTKLIKFYYKKTLLPLAVAGNYIPLYDYMNAKVDSNKMSTDLLLPFDKVTIIF